MNTLRHYKYIYFMLWLLIDYITVILTYSASLWGRTFGEWYFHNRILVFISIAAVVNVATLYLNGVYRRLWSQTSGQAVSVLVLANLEAGTMLFIFNFLVEQRILPVSVIIMGQALTLMGMVALRYRSRLLSGLEWRWRAVWLQQFPERHSDDTRVLVVGAGYAGQKFVQHIHTMGATTNFKIVGFVDDAKEKQYMLVEGEPVLGIIDQLPELTKRHKIDLIAIAIHNISSERFRYILDTCQKTSAKIKVIPSLDHTTQDQKAPLLRDVDLEDIIGRKSLDSHPVIDLSLLKGKCVLVTGAAGSIGGELSQQLANCHLKHLLLLDNNESGLFDVIALVKQINPQLSLTQILADISDPYALSKAFQTHQPEVVFHAAAYKHVPMLEDHPYQAVRVNVGGTLNLLEQSLLAGVERFVLISSDKAVNSTSVMGATKYVCEQLVRSVHLLNPQHPIQMAIVRFGNVIGSRGSVIPMFERQIAMGGPVTITDERMTRYFMSIKEAVHLVLQAGCMTQGDDLFILRMGESVRIIELAERLIRLRGLRPNIDIPIRVVGIRPGETLHEKLLRVDEDQFSTEHPFIFRVGCHPIIEPTEFYQQARQLVAESLYYDEEALKQALFELVGDTASQVEFIKQLA